MPLRSDRGRPVNGRLPALGFLMPSEKMPHDLIRELVAKRASWSDADVIAEIEQLPALADEADEVC